MRRLARVEKHRRGFFGNVVKVIFIGFNIMMVVWALFALLATAGLLHVARNDAEAVGAIVGASIGAGILANLWFWGALLLGLFMFLTRGPKITYEEEVDTDRETIGIVPVWPGPQRLSRKTTIVAICAGAVCFTLIFSILIAADKAQTGGRATQVTIAH